MREDVSLHCGNLGEATKVVLWHGPHCHECRDWKPHCKGLGGDVICVCGHQDGHAHEIVPKGAANKGLRDRGAMPSCAF